MSEKVTIQQTNLDLVRIIQITDTHIFADANKRFGGLDTIQTLTAVINHIKQLQQQPDLIIMTGDLVHDPDKTAYERLYEKLVLLDAPVYCIAGNHDDPEIMHAALNNSNISTHNILESEDWTILLLNSYSPDTDAGYLSAQELAFLQTHLSGTVNKHVLVCLHHPPVIIGSAWLDTMMLQNAEAFFDVIDRFEQIQGVLWGHIHQDFLLQRKNVSLMGSPSTCVQFKPMTKDYAQDDELPGYRELILHSTGKISTSITRLTANEVNLQ